MFFFFFELSITYKCILIISESSEATWLLRIFVDHPFIFEIPCSFNVSIIILIRIKFNFNKFFVYFFWIYRSKLLVLLILSNVRISFEQILNFLKKLILRISIWIYFILFWLFHFFRFIWLVDLLFLILKFFLELLAIYLKFLILILKIFYDLIFTIYIFW